MLFLANVGRISSRREEFQIPPEDLENHSLHLMNLNNRHTAIRGTPTWIPIELKSLDGYHEIVLEASFHYEATDENPDEYRDRSRVGIWTAVKDAPMVASIASQSDSYSHGDQENVQILLNEWRFGKNSQIAFTFSNTMQHTNLSLAVCAIPFFHARDGQNAETCLTLTLKGMAKGELYYDTVDSKEIRFKLDRNASKVQNRGILQLFAEMGAFQLDGSGNSVHPKQLYTTRALKNQIKVHESDDIEIAYIGTDTTENLRALIRQIKADHELSNTITKLSIYFTEDWDAELMMQYPNLDLNNADTGGKFELTFKQLPSDGTLPASVESVDFVLSTYVTPWAMEDEKNKNQYIQLIQSLLKEPSSRLISVDPSDSSKSIRSYCKDTNLQSVYISTLGLKLADTEHSGEDMVVDCKVWRRDKVSDDE